MTEDGHVWQVKIEEVDHFSLKEATVAVEEGVEDPIDQIPDRSTKNNGQRYVEGDQLVGGIPPDKVDKKECRTDREEGEQNRQAEVESEGHARVLDKGEPEKVADEGHPLPKRHPVMLPAKDVESLYGKLGDLVDHNNQAGEKKELTQRLFLILPEPIEVMLAGSAWLRCVLVDCADLGHRYCGEST